MSNRFRLLALNFSSGAMLLLMLCIGAQNASISSRHPLKIGMASTAPLPIGFLVGVSMLTGVVSVGSTFSLIVPRSQD